MSEPSFDEIIPIVRIIDEKKAEVKDPFGNRLRFWEDLPAENTN